MSICTRDLVKYAGRTWRVKARNEKKGTLDLESIKGDGLAKYGLAEGEVVLFKSMRADASRPKPVAVTQRKAVPPGPASYPVEYNDDLTGWRRGVYGDGKVVSPRELPHLDTCVCKTCRAPSGEKVGHSHMDGYRGRVTKWPALESDAYAVNCKMHVGDAVEWLTLAGERASGVLLGWSSMGPVVECDGRLSYKSAKTLSVVFEEEDDAASRKSEEKTIESLGIKAGSQVWTTYYTKGTGERSEAEKCLVVRLRRSTEEIDISHRGHTYTVPVQDVAYVYGVRSFQRAPEYTLKPKSRRKSPKHRAASVPWDVAYEYDPERWATKAEYTADVAKREKLLAISTQELLNEEAKRIKYVPTGKSEASASKDTVQEEPVKVVRRSGEGGW